MPGMADQQFEYRYVVHNYQHPDVAQEKMDTLVADGWHVHTAALAHPELHILWERAVPKVKEERPRSRGTAGAS